MLNNFLDQNIFRIEKIIDNFLRTIVLIIENEQILNVAIGIKKKNYGEKINKRYLESSLVDLKNLFKQNYQDNTIMHFIINNFFVDGVNYKTFDKEIEGDYMCVEVNFISAPNNLIVEIRNILEKYQIKIDCLYEKRYIENFFEGYSLDLSIIAFKIQNGYIQNEISLVPKTYKKIGFFEKFFKLFS